MKVISRSPVFSALTTVAVIGGGLRVYFLERIEREYHVVRRDRLAVVPFCFRPQPIGGRGEVVRIAHRLGKQPVFARYFVERRHQQRVVDAIDAEDERAFDAGDRHVEVVVGAKRDLPRRTALRRAGVDIVELLEAGWIFQFAERRYAVPPRRGFAACASAAARPGGQREAATQPA